MGNQETDEKVLRIFELNRYRTLSLLEAHSYMELQGFRFHISLVKREIKDLKTKGKLIKIKNGVWQYNND